MIKFISRVSRLINWTIKQKEKEREIFSKTVSPSILSKGINTYSVSTEYAIEIKLKHA